MTRKVLIYAGGVKDYTAASRFGELVFESPGSKNLRKVGRQLGDILGVMVKMRRAGEPAPYLLITGHGVLSGLLMVCGLEVWGEVPILIFDAKTENYNEEWVSKRTIGEYIKNLESEEAE
jgi:hypothetical protein